LSFHLLNAFLVGVTKLEAFLMVQSDEIKPLQTVTSVWLVNISGEFKGTVA
jgi:hypothetical protein